MAEGSTKRRHNRSLIMIPRVNIKTENSHDWNNNNNNARRAKMRSSKYFVKTEKPNNQKAAGFTANCQNQMFYIKTEKIEDGENSIFGPSSSAVNIKTERVDEFNDDGVSFLPSSSNVSVPSPPQKKKKLNNGNWEDANPPVHSNRSAHNNNAGTRNNNYNNNNYNFYTKNNYFNRSLAESPISERILRNVQLSAYEIRLLMLERRQECMELFEFLSYQDERERNESYIDRLIVAKIRVLNRANVKPEQMHRAMRRNLVDLIERYQAKWLKTPCYHNFFIDKAFLVVICADSYAYACLSEYINNTYGQVNIESIPRHIGHILHCYAATADELIYDTNRFLRQIYLHVSSTVGGAKTVAKWILARHYVHREDGFTSFVFLMDYISSLTLEYVHKYRLFVCMLEVKFSYCGNALCNF